MENVTIIQSGNTFFDMYGFQASESYYNIHACTLNSVATYACNTFNITRGEITRNVKEFIETIGLDYLYIDDTVENYVIRCGNIVLYMELHKEEIGKLVDFYYNL